MKKTLLITAAILAFSSAANGASLVFQFLGGGLTTSAGVPVSTSDFTIAVGTFGMAPGPGDSFSSIQSAFNEVASSTADLIDAGAPGFYNTTFMTPETGEQGQQVYMFAYNAGGSEYGVFTSPTTFADPGGIPPTSVTTFSQATAFAVVGGVAGPDIGNGASFQLIPEPTTGLFGLLTAGLVFFRRRRA